MFLVYHVELRGITRFKLMLRFHDGCVWLCRWMIIAIVIILVVLILNGYVLLLFSINYLVLLLVNARGLVLGEDRLAACLASCGASNRHEASLAVVFPEL